MEPMRKITYKSIEKKQCTVCKKIYPIHQFYYAGKCLACSQADAYNRAKQIKEDESGTDHETLEEIMSPMEMDDKAWEDWMQFLIEKSPFKRIDKEIPGLHD